MLYYTYYKYCKQCCTILTKIVNNVVLYWQKKKDCKESQAKAFGTGVSCLKQSKRDPSDFNFSLYWYGIYNELLT